MSLSSMANMATARHLGHQAQTGSLPEMAAAKSAGGAQSSAASGSSITDALDVITAHIPTEILTLYVAVLGTLATSNGDGPSEPALWASFWTFLICTPVVVWLLFAAKVRSRSGELPLAPRSWPWWEMAAGTTAFAIWALALPETPFKEFDWYNRSLSGLLVLAGSAILGLLAPVFQPRMGT